MPESLRSTGDRRRPPQHRLADPRRRAVVLLRVLAAQGRGRRAAAVDRRSASSSPTSPTFVSVTYGAGGSTRDTTVRITGRIARETSMVPMAHLTCVGHTREELERHPRRLRRGGVHNVLALRGDPREGPRAPWTPDRGRVHLRQRAGRAGAAARLHRRRRRLPGRPPRRRSPSSTTPRCCWPSSARARSSRSPTWCSGRSTTPSSPSARPRPASTSRSCRGSCRS